MIAGFVTACGATLPAPSHVPPRAPSHVPPKASQQEAIGPSTSAVQAARRLVERDLLPRVFETPDDELQRGGASVVRSPGGSLLLRAKSRDGALIILEGFVSLRKLTDGDAVPPLPAVHVHPSGWWEAKLDDVISSFLGQSLGKVEREEQHDVDGPLAETFVNCWGNAAYLRRIFQAPHYVPFRTFARVMDLPVCRPLRSDEQVATGDIIDMRVRAGDAHDDRDGHASIAVTRDFWCSKAGPTLPYRCESSRSTLLRFERFATRSGCLGETRLDEGKRKESFCGVSFAVRRCMSTDAFRRTIGGSAITYDALVTEALPFLWESVHRQHLAEQSGDLALGESAPSTIPYRPFRVRQAVIRRWGAIEVMDEDLMSPEVAPMIDAVERDTYWAPSIRPFRIPPLPPFSKGTEPRMAWQPRYEALERKVTQALAGALSERERTLMELLKLELASSSLSRSDGR